MPETRAADLRTGTVIATATARRAARGGLVIGLVLGGLVANEALSYRSNFPTQRSRTEFAASFGTSGGLTAVTGPARQLDTAGGFVAWRMFSLLLVVGAVWGMLAATRLMRGEEDAGRWEILLSGRTDRRRAAGQAMAGLATGYAVLWLVVTVATVVAGTRPSVGFTVADSVIYATAGTAGAAVFLAVGALAAQLASTRRQANALAAAVLGLSYLLRMVADGSSGLGWLRWATPLGWLENVAPLTDPRPAALLPAALLVVVAAGTAVVLAGRRDAGTGLLARPGAGPRRVRPVDGPLRLAFRLERGVALAWVGGLAALALVFGLVARAASEGRIVNGGVQQAVGGRAGPAATWIGYELLYLAAILALAAVGQVSALRSEEADGRLEHLLVRPFDRRTWLAGRLLVGGLLVAAAGLAVGVAAWAGVGGRGGIGLATMLAAGLSTAVPGLFVLGLGALLFGLVPRLAAPLLYAVVAWSFLVEILGASLTRHRVLLDSSLLAHLGAAPATPTHWAEMASMLVLAAAAALAGLALFVRRDLSAA